MNRTSYEKPAVRRVIPLSELGKTATPRPTPPRADGMAERAKRDLDSGLPQFGHRFRSLDPLHPEFREPVNGEWVVGLYTSEDGKKCPMLLWADPKVDLFWDPSRLEHVKPPGSYLMLEDQPKIDGESGYPIKGGVVSPF
jgi:hypothetical protein